MLKRKRVEDEQNFFENIPQVINEYLLSFLTMEDLTTGTIVCVKWRYINRFVKILQKQKSICVLKHLQLLHTGHFILNSMDTIIHKSLKNTSLMFIRPGICSLDVPTLKSLKLQRATGNENECDVVLQNTPIKHLKLCRYVGFQTDTPHSIKYITIHVVVVTLIFHNIQICLKLFYVNLQCSKSNIPLVLV